MCRPLRASALAASSAPLFPLETIESFVRWDLQWTNPITVWRWEAFSMAIIWFALVTDPPLVISTPCPFQLVAWIRMIWKACLESV